jgi:hypothetical protein
VRHPMTSLIFVCLIGALIGATVTGRAWAYLGKRHQSATAQGTEKKDKESKPEGSSTQGDQESGQSQGTPKLPPSKPELTNDQKLVVIHRLVEKYKRGHNGKIPSANWVDGKLREQGRNFSLKDVSPPPAIIEGNTFTNNGAGNIQSNVPIQAQDNLMRGPLNSIVGGDHSKISGNTQIVAPYDFLSTKNMDKPKVLLRIQEFYRQGDTLRSTSDAESRKEEEIKWAEEVKQFLSESWNQSHVNQWDTLHGDGTIRDEIAKRLLLLRSFASEIRTNP